MSIHALPPSSISSLTATQVLTQPPSLIKELIENSIDASATLISVEITPNCLDVLQVKDNGHGILPGGDRESLCRRGWTSKISKWEDVERWMGLGGPLGFRGEALAAAADMAGGGVEVTTRVEGEKVGWVGVYSRTGGLVSQSSKSVPIGTIVKVMGFLKDLPVRRETAVKSASKNLQQIRRIMMTYALSHLKVRFSLKVLPAGPRTKPAVDDNWVCSPSRTVQEAVMKIFGKELAGGGVWVESSGGSGDGGRVEIQAFLVGRGIDPSSLLSKGKLISGGMSFVFVDYRPISCSRRGPFKSLLSLYKDYIRSSLLTANPDNHPLTVSEPFIYLNILCKAAGMYDPNIEPAKDDVLFRDWQRDVLGVVEGMFRETYGELKGKEKAEKEARRPQGVDGVDFGVLLAKKPAPAVEAQESEESEEPTAPSRVVGKERETANRVETAGTSSAVPTLPGNSPVAILPSETSNARPQRVRRPTWGFSMSANLIDESEFDDAGEEYIPPPPPPLAETEAARKDVSLSNPWVMAKMNASVKGSSSPMRGAGASSPGMRRTPRGQSGVFMTARELMSASVGEDEVEADHPLPGRGVGHGGTKFTQRLPARSPHRNRQKTATAALSMAVGTVVSDLTRGSVPTLASDNEEEPRTKRPKTRTHKIPRHLLPLERVAPEERMQSVSVTIHLSGLGAVEKVAREVGRLNLGEENGMGLMMGSWVGEVLGEWLRGKVSEEEGEEVSRVKWVWEEGADGGDQSEGEGEGEEEVGRLVAFWD